MLGTSRVLLGVLVLLFSALVVEGGVRPRRQRYIEPIFIEEPMPTHDETVGEAGQAPSFSLPLATKMNHNEEEYIPPETFGNTAWDPVRGAPKDAHPSPAYKTSTVLPGQQTPFPPGTRPQDNPMMYIMAPALVEEKAETHRREMLEVGEGEGSPPSFVMPLATKLNDNTKLYIQPGDFGFEEWDPVNGMPKGERPDPAGSHSHLPAGFVHPWPPGTPAQENPNSYIQPPPMGITTAITDKVMAAELKDTRENKIGGLVGKSRVEMMKFNAFPSEKPYFTNTRPVNENGGLPMAVGNPELRVGEFPNTQRSEESSFAEVAAQVECHFCEFKTQ